MQYLRMKSAEQKGPSLLTNESHLRFAIPVRTTAAETKMLAYASEATYFTMQSL
jgi:hypothetical protein